jgi:hypothetical protein
MRRRCCVEFINHATIRITAFNYQRTYDLKQLKRDDKQIDLITSKTITRSDVSSFKCEIDFGAGTLESPFNLFIIAETRKGIYEVIQEFSLSTGREHVFECDLP